jgi:uncharacterized protein (DUF1778 family)
LLVQQQEQLILVVAEVVEQHNLLHLQGEQVVQVLLSLKKPQDLTKHQVYGA